MKSKKQRSYGSGLGRLLFVVVLAALCCACVTTSSRTKKADPKLAAEYMQKARQLEEKGELPAALQQYKLALTADPKNTAAGENHARLVKQLNKLADERYQLGMKYYRIGKYGLARKEFLTALKFNPDHKAASGMLVSRKPDKMPKYTFHVIQPGESLSIIAKNYYGDYKKYELIARFNHLEDATKVRPGQRIMIPETEDMLKAAGTSGKKEDTADSYVLHTIKPGESISKLAQQYYNDYKLFHAIAQFNGMDDATRVTVGQTIKVPRLAGVPFHLPSEQEEKATADQQQAYNQKPMEETEDLGTPPAEEASGQDEQSLAYRDSGIELFNDGRYGDAIFELNKAIEASPEDKKTASYLGRAYFEAGKQHFQDRDFDAARESFESALQYDPQCDQCQAYIEKSKMGPLLTHRTRGMDAFEKNDFMTAIFEFEAYTKIKPDDKDIRTYLSRSYYQQALINYNKGDYLTAKKGFDSALEYDSTCEKCASYSKKSIQSHKEAHYNKGIVYFSKEQLAEAISEWKMVYDLDPGYKDVEQNLKKAQALLEKLEKIKKSQQ